jgi:predicted membrane protein
MVIIAIFTAKISPNSYRRVFTCQEILFMYEDPTIMLTKYPSCANITSQDDPVYVIVTATLKRSNREEVAAMLDMCFGAAGWAAGTLHIFAVEIYLSYTRGEDERLKKVSEARRKAAKME